MFFFFICLFLYSLKSQTIKLSEIDSKIGNNLFDKAFEQHWRQIPETFTQLFQKHESKEGSSVYVRESQWIFGRTGIIQTCRNETKKAYEIKVSLVPTSNFQIPHYHICDFKIVPKLTRVIVKGKDRVLVVTNDNVCSIQQDNTQPSKSLMSRIKDSWEGLREEFQDHPFFNELQLMEYNFTEEQFSSSCSCSSSSSLMHFSSSSSSTLLS